MELLLSNMKTHTSMPEQELLGIDQHPAEIFGGGPEIGAGLEVLGRGGELDGGGSAAEGDEVELSGDRLGGLATPGEPSDPAVVIVELAVDGRAADELEGLRQVRVALALALAGQLSRGAAEGLQERVVHLAVGHLCGSGAWRQALERRGCAGNRRDGVEQDFGRQELGQGVREVQIVV